MIVISHPWEFVPKGNSHFNYHTGSSSNANGDSKNEKDFDKNMEMQLNPNGLNNLQQQQFQKSQLNSARINPPLIISDDERWKMDKDSSFGDFSYGFPHKSPIKNKMNFEKLINEKWHLTQINEFCENELYINENKVILSYGSDNYSKIVKRTFTFESPIFDLKNCWKLKDGILFERQVDSTASKNIYLRENSKQIIIGVIDSLNLVLVFSVLNNIHYIYRINEYVSEDSQVVNNLLNNTNIHAIEKNTDILNTNSINFAHQNPPVTPLHKINSGSCLSMSINQCRKRLSVSPIISTYSFYNKLNSPMINHQQNSLQQQQQLSTTLTGFTNNPTNPTANPSFHLTNPNSTTITSVHQHYFQRNFSPMATLSRSPSCSSSPAIISGVRRNVNCSAAINSNTNVLSIKSTSNSLRVPNNLNVIPNALMTPSIDSNIQSHQFKTPLNLQNQQQNTPINNYRRNFTPQMNNTTFSALFNNENLSESVYEQITPEYCLDCVWTEPNVIAGSSEFIERATKFFNIVDLYNQKYVCYLLPGKSQLRCIKVEYNSNMECFLPTGLIHYIPAKDSVFVESRNLMVILDNQGNMVAYSGLTKLCKLQLHNISWCNPSLRKTIFPSIKPLNKDIFHSPIVTPIKSKLFGKGVSIAGADNDSDITNSAKQNLAQHVFKTPKQEGGILMPNGSTIANNHKDDKNNPISNIFNQYQEFKSLVDSTGSRFSVKLGDNRMIRINLSQASTCKLVNTCLEAFKYTLSKEIYYEIIQQWYINRYSINGESLRDQLNVFLCLILNLCGCFDMNRLEQDLPILFPNKNKNSSVNENKNVETKPEINETPQAVTNEISKENNQELTANKRAKCLYEGTDEDWDYLINDDLLAKFVENENNLHEFTYLNLKDKKTFEKPVERQEKHLTTPKASVLTEAVNENIKTSGLQFTRQKRPIVSTTASMFGTLSNLTNTGSISSGGILFPYLKQILYTLHLIYEETKLFRSLTMYTDLVIQVLYLLANELNLSLYMNYYEQECPLLIRLKSFNVFKSYGNNNLGTSNPTPSSSSSSIPPKNSSSSYLNTIINQEPPILHKFLLKLIEMPINEEGVSTFINPFPIIGNVTSRTVKSIKIYALIALCTKPELKSLSFNDYLNQLFFRINFSGFQHDNFPQSNSNMSTFVNNSNNNEKNQGINSSFHNFYPNYTLKFTYKPGENYIYENIFSLCLEMGLCSLNEIYDYPYAVLFPVLEAIHWCRENPCFSWPAYAFDLIGRNDLSILKTNTDSLSAEAAQNNLTSSNNKGVNLLDNSELQSTLTKPSTSITNYAKNNSINYLAFGKKSSTIKNQNTIESNQFLNENNLTIHISQNLKKDDEDGMAHVMQLETLKCRFNEDLRIKEVRSCLQTTRPIQIKLNQGPDVSDHDFVEEEEKFLACICVRTMSLPFGRGIFTLHTINPIPTEPVIIPELNLKGKSVTKKTTIDLTRVEVPVNMTYWPLFHNGVASGLTIHAQAKDLSNSWIKSHLAKNFELTNEQAGFLYGLGLTGHLSTFSMLNIHDALTRRHDLTNIAILLGLASSKIGSMDLSVTRLISMHIKALMPPVEIELEIPYNIQIAALLSLGLVYVKSANKHICYVLLKEIGRLPGNEIDKDLHSLDREAYSLTAGLALGMILLEKGKKSLTIMDSTFTDELYHYMVGGHKEKYVDGYVNNSNQYGNFTGTSGISGSNASNQASNTNGASNTDHNFPSYSTNSFRSTNSSHIREGESINTNITCPGATLALGLIYFNSCDKLISEWFAPPDSAFLLDSIRPDFLLLRTVARNLIMWKYILPTQTWILNQLSNLLKTNIKNDKILSEKFSSQVFSVNTETIAKKKITKHVEVQRKGSKVTFNLNNKDVSENSEEYLSPHGFSYEDDDDSSTPPSSNGIDKEMSEEINDDTDEDDNIVVQKEKKYKVKKSILKKTKLKQKHFLSDLIQFDDVEDDFFHEIGEAGIEGAKIEASSKTKSSLIDSSKKAKATREKSDEELDDYEDLGVNIDSNSDSSTSHSNNLIDEDTKTEAFRHIIAGACMSMGLRFAGTCNKEAYETLLFWANYFTNLNDTKLSTENCLCVIVLSLAMVMSGSGDLEVLRICRYLRSRVGPNLNHVLYGSQMAINMAIGLLFMGGGRYTLKTDSLSVALMICAFYPHFPVDSHDNRFHLQAFRHLYVLASEPRLLLSKDVDTNEFCYVPIEITLKANEHHETFKYQQMAPCLLPELNRIQELKILGPRYYQIKFKNNLHFDDLKNILLSELLVKQKNGYFSYTDDPKDEKAFNVRNILNKTIVPHKITPALLEQITNEEYINLFAKMLNKSNENDFNDKTNRLLQIIYESVVQETFDFVGVILLMEKEAIAEPKTNFIQQIKLVETFYKTLKSKKFTKNQIINQEFLVMTINSIESRLRLKLKKNLDLIKVYLNDNYTTGIEDLIHYSVLNDINKAEIEYFLKCEKFSDLFRMSAPNSIKPENLLKLFQLFRN